jgi:hypothetical protein
MVLALAGVCPLQAQEPEGDGNAFFFGGPETVATAEAVPHSDYWLGLEVFPPTPALRAQLDLSKQEGLVVEQIVADGPAAKSGVKQYDVLLKAGDRSLHNMADLVQAVNAVKDGKLSLELLRGGKKQTVSVTPAKRPAEGKMPAPPLAAMDRETVEKWMQGLMPGGNRQFQFHVIHPGAILPPGAPLPKLPDNTSVSIVREGSKPAKITVKEGDKSWEVTENDLGKLPENLRPLVEQMLGHGPLTVFGGGELLPEPFNRMLAPPDVRRQMEDMNRRLDEMRKTLDELRPGKSEKKTDAKPEKTSEAESQHI